MAINTTANRIAYAGNGVTLAFAFPYAFLAGVDLVVILTNAAGVDTTKVITTDYSVAGGSGASGTVTMVVAPAVGETLTIYDDPAVTQNMDLVENGPLPAETVEQAFDRLTIICQRLKDRVDRSFRLAEGFSSTFSLIMPSSLPRGGIFFVNAAATGISCGPGTAASRAGLYLAFDSNGDPYGTTGPVSGVPVSVFMATLLDDADAATARTTLAVPSGTDTFTNKTMSFSENTFSHYDNPKFSSNISISASVAASALTIALKGADGANCSATNKGRICFRSATLTSGLFVQRTIGAALSLVISSGSTLGHAASVAHDIYIYAIDNAGTVEPAVSSHGFWDEGVLQSTTAEGGAGAADSSAVLYSATARTNVAVRLIGKLISTQVTPGTWATAPSNVHGLPAVTPVVARANLTTAQTGITNKVIPFNVVNKDTVNGFSAGVYTVKSPGDYFATGNTTMGNLDGATDAKIQIRKNGTVVADSFAAKHTSGAAASGNARVTDILNDCVAGDTIDFFVVGDASFDLDSNGSRTWCAIHRI